MFYNFKLLPFPCIILHKNTFYAVGTKLEQYLQFSPRKVLHRRSHTPTRSDISTTLTPIAANS